jgi:hypothetical protein
LSKVKGNIWQKGAIRAFFIAKLHKQQGELPATLQRPEFRQACGRNPREAVTVSAREEATLGQTPEFCGLLI